MHQSFHAIEGRSEGEDHRPRAFGTLWILRLPPSISLPHTLRWAGVRGCGSGGSTVGKRSGGFGPATNGPPLER